MDDGIEKQRIEDRLWGVPERWKRGREAGIVPAVGNLEPEPPQRRQEDARDRDLGRSPRRRCSLALLAPTSDREPR